MSGYKVNRITVAPPPLTQYLEKRALTDGFVASDVFLGGRNISAIVTAYGTSAGDFWDKAQALHRVMSAPLRRQKAIDDDQANTEGFGFLSFYQPTASTAVGQWPTSTYPDGIPLAYEVRPIQIEYDLERSKDASESDEPQSKSFNLLWFAKDPRKIHTTYASTSVSSDTTTATVAYRGDYPNWPIVQFTMTSVGIGDLTIVIDGFSVAIATTEVTTGFPKTIYVDYNTRAIWDGDPLDEASTLRNDLFATFPTLNGFVQVRSGSTFQATGLGGGGPIASATLKVREAFA
jgi:hypothetical protein